LLIQKVLGLLSSSTGLSGFLDYQMAKWRNFAVFWINWFRINEVLLHSQPWKCKSISTTATDLTCRMLDSLINDFHVAVLN
jgi:hypothetical protein